MSPAARVPVPAWTRRVRGWSFLLFFLSLIVLSVVAVESWNTGNIELSGYFAGLASVLPLLLVVVTYYALPLWGINVPAPPEDVAAALAAVAGRQTVEPVAVREGPFARCVSVVRLHEPRCTVGWAVDPTRPGGSSQGTVVVLRPESRDRKALAAFRESLARSLRGASGSAV